MNRFTQASTTDRRYRHAELRVLVLLLLVTMLSLSVGSASEPQVADIDALRNQFANPPAHSGTANHWLLNGTLTKEKIRSRMLEMRDKEGFRGVVPIGFAASTRPAFLSDEYVEMYAYILDTAKEFGMTVVFYDDERFPSGKAGFQMAEKYPEHLLKYLARGMSTVEGPTTASVQVPTGKIMSVVAKNRRTGEMRVVTKDATWSEDGAGVECEVPKGAWEVQAFVCATAPRRYLVDFLDPEAVEKFIGLAYEPFYKRSAAHFGTTIQMAFFDDLSVYQAPDNLLWTPSFNEKFEAKFGRSPEPLYPALWEDIGTDTESARVSLYGLRNEMFAAGYPKTVQEWCADRGIVVAGHPANPYRPNPLQSMGDAMLFSKYQAAPTTDYIQYLGNGVDGFKIPASAAYNFDRELMVCEIYAAFKFDPRDTKMLYRGAMHVYARGINCLLPLGANWNAGESSNDISMYNPKIGQQGIFEFNRWAARCEPLLRAGRHMADIAVVYPIDDLESRYSVDLQPERASKDPIPGTDYYELSRLLTSELKREFTFLHPETINDRCVVDGTEFVLDNLRNCERYRVVILPACRTIRVDNLIKIQTFLNNGGHVIATTCLPEKSAEFGRDSEVQAMASEMFGPGGKGIFVPSPDVHTIGSVLDRLPMVWNVRVDNTTDIPSTHVDRGPSPTGGEQIDGNREFAFIHRRITESPTSDCDVYYFANSSDMDVDADVTMRGRLKLEAWDPHTGAVHALSTSSATERDETMTRWKLHLPAVRSVFIVGRPE